MIDEWRPIWQQRPAGLLFAFTCIGIVAAIVRGNRHVLRVEDWLTLGLFSALAVASGRNLIWWSLVVPPVIGASLRRPPRRRGRRTSMRIVRIAMARHPCARPRPTPQNQNPSRCLRTRHRGSRLRCRARLRPGDTSSQGGGSAGSRTRCRTTRCSSTRVPSSSRPRCGTSTSRSHVRTPVGPRLLDRRGVDVVVASRGHQASLIDAMSGDARWRQLVRGRRRAWSSCDPTAA